MYHENMVNKITNGIHHTREIDDNMMCVWWLVEQWRTHCGYYVLGIGVLCDAHGSITKNVFKYLLFF